MECSECGGSLPIIRRPANLRQALWGGWTCPHCSGEFDRWTRLIVPARAGFPSHPAGLSVSAEKLQRLRPELFGFAGWIHRLQVKVGLEWDQLEYLERHLFYGDGRAAVVVSVDPLLVAAYTDELDGVAILGFPDELIDDYHLRVGSRLLTVNTYTLLHRGNTDVEIGPLASGQWNGFNPVIGEFITDDMKKVDELKRQIPEEEWQRCLLMGKASLHRQPDLVRDGRPIFSGVSAKAEFED